MSNYAPTRSTYATSSPVWARDLLKAETHGITLDGTAFPAATFPGGIVPSGVAIAKRDADSLGVPAGTALSAPAGHLVNEEKVTTGSRNLVAVLHGGTVTERFLPSNAQMSAAVKTALTAVVYI